MAPTHEHTCTSAGTKVDAGKNAPVAREGAGHVAPESLAAESYRQGGGFASNRGASPDGTTFASSKPLATRQTLDSQTQSSKQADTAPSYVAAQYATGQGPHGNWAKQEGMESAKLEPGLQRALRSEPGSADDPSRVAEARFAQPRVAGRRDAELATGSAFDGLESDAAA